MDGPEAPGVPLPPPPVLTDPNVVPIVLSGAPPNIWFKDISYIILILTPAFLPAVFIGFKHKKRTG